MCAVSMNGGWLSAVAMNAVPRSAAPMGILEQSQKRPVYRRTRGVILLLHHARPGAGLTNNDQKTLILRTRSTHEVSRCPSCTVCELCPTQRLSTQRLSTQRLSDLALVLSALV